MVASRGLQNNHTYNFYYRLTTNDTWSSVGTIHHTAAFSRVALCFKGSQMNVAFNHFIVTTLALGHNHAYTTNADNTLTITDYAGSDSTLVIPDQIDNLPVSAIGDYAFNTCSSLTNVTIPSGVTTIGKYAFYRCRNLTSVTLPDSVTTVSDGAFFYCTALNAIALPGTLSTIGNSAFFNCSSLTNVVIPDNVTTLGTSIFSACGGLASVTLPKGLTTIPDSAFYNCTSLPTIVIPGNVTTLGAAAFSYTAITAITLQNGLSMISDSCFSGCSSLTNVVISSSVTNIGSYAFESCVALTRITLPNRVTGIGEYAFNNCYSLTSATLPSGLTYIPCEMFGYCFNLRALYFQGNAPDADWSAFDCDSDIILYYRPSTTGWENLSTNTGYPARLWNEDIYQLLEIPAPSVSPVAIPTPIGGWLVLPAIGLIVGSILSVAGIIMNLALASKIPSQYEGIFALNLSSDVGLTAFTIYAATRFFGKRRNAPATMIAFMIAVIAVNGLLLAISIQEDADPFAIGCGKALVKGVVSALIWIPYFCVSERVKRTFVIP